MTPLRESDDIQADFEAHLRTVIKLFNSPTGTLIRELLAESQSDDSIAEEFRDRFWKPRRDLSRQRLQRGIELGEIRTNIDQEIVLDAIYGPVWLRLMIGHLPMKTSHARRTIDAIWRGVATDGISHS